MRMRFSAVVWLLFVSSLLSLASPANGQTPETLGQIERLDPALDAVLDSAAKIEVLASGFTWCEGPVWIADAKKPEDGYLLFSDIPRNTIFRWDPKTGISRFMQPSGYTGTTFYGLEPGSNGLAVDGKGQLLACEHGDRRLSVLTKEGGKRTLVDSYQGKRLNSPNDLVVDSKGNIYFTDPPYGLPERADDRRRELDFCGVYRLATDGTLQLVSKQLERPNGIGLSPDETTLYVAQSDPSNAIWMSFPIASDGSLEKGTIMHDATDQVDKLPGLPDGLTVSASGHIWASGPGGIYVFSPEGKLLGRILTGQRTSNCTLGGPESERNWLYITADSYLLRIQIR